MKLNDDKLLSSFAFKPNLRRYNQVGGAAVNKTLYDRLQLNVTGRLDIISVSDGRMVKVSGDIDIRMVGCCKVTVSKPELKACLVSAICT